MESGSPQNRMNNFTHVPNGLAIHPSPQSNVLLSPDHFMSSMGPAGDNHHVLPKQHMPTHAMNVDVPGNDFMNAVNFSVSNGHYGQANGDEDEALSQHLELESGMFEQHAAKEQAALLSRFQQLRDWQSQQQAWLLRQQQEQLALLQNEQLRVQRMIAKQRNQNWGEASMPSNNSSDVPFSHSAQNNTAVATNPPKNRSTLPHAIAQGTLALAHGPGNGRIHRPDNERTPEKARPGNARLPQPVLPDTASTPSEYYQNGNPELDSDTNTVASAAGLDDGIGPLNPHPASDLPHQANNTVLPPRLNFDESDSDKENYRDAGPENGYYGMTGGVNEAVWSEDADYGYHHEGLKGDFKASDEEYQDHVNDDDDDEYDDDDVVDADLELPPENGFDEVPVSGLANRKKTFEELLEEELRKEELRLQDTENAGSKKSQKTRHFLRRGEGVARFQSGPKPRKPVRKPTAKTNSKQVTQQNSKPMIQKPPTKKTNEVPISKETVKNISKKSFKSPPRLGDTVPVSFPSNMTSPRQQIVKRSPKNPVKDLAKSLPASRPADSIGEISFQQCMHAREKNEEVESHELHEFEILERYADDNASFLSNMSAVNRVLNVKPVRSIADQAKSSAVVVSPGDDTDDDASEWSDKSPQHPVSNNTLHTGRSTTSSSSLASHSNPAATTASRKLTGNDKTGLEHLKRVEHFSDSESDVIDVRTNAGLRGFVPAGPIPENDSDLSDSFVSDSDPKPFNRYSASSSSFVKSQADHSPLITQLSPQRKSPAKSSVNRKVSKMSSPRVNDLYSSSCENVCDVPSPHELHKKSHAKENDSASATAMENGRQSEDVWNFGDEDSWDDEDNESEEEIFTSDQNKAAIIKTKVSPEEFPAPRAAVRPSQLASEQPPTPPTSQLVSKLFPKLKQDKPKQKLQPQQEQALLAARETGMGDGIQSKALREKLAELENEIERFRRENAAMTELRKEREEGCKQLKKEMDEFQKQKEAELASINQHRAAEMKKLKKERRIFEQAQKAAKAGPDRKERLEIDSLKSKVSELEEEIKKKEQRWAASSSRLRDRIESLETENKELKEEIKILEKRRLEAWQQKEQKPEVKKLPQSLGPTSSPAPVPTSSSHLQEAPSLHTSPPAATAVPAQTRLMRTLPPLASSQPPVHSQSKTEARQDESRDEDGISKEGAAPVARSQPRPQTLKTTPLSPRRSNASPELAGAASAARRSLPRKTAVAMNISRAVDMGDGQFEELQHTDGKLERVYTNGAREILYSNGTRKQVSSDGQSIIVSFFNGDVKQILPDQRVVYYYADAQTTHTTFPDGLEIIQFPNNQTEKHYPDGTKEITFADQTMKYLFPGGTEESILPDGTVIRVDATGDKVMEFPSGQREIHTQHYKRREYPDGTVKTVYPDGRQETRYSSGRVRVKDRDGNIIVDRRM